MKKFFENLLAISVLALVIFGVYFLNYKMGGPLTTTSSCSSSYFQGHDDYGQYDLKALRKDCPSLTKKSLIENVELYFQNHSDANGRSRADVMKDIENNF